MRNNRPTVITGNAVMIRKFVTSVIQLNVGRRIIFRPGARRFRMVTTKLNPAASDETPRIWRDRKSTRLNSSHLVISYAVFCLKKKKEVLHVRDVDGIQLGNDTVQQGIVRTRLHC